jgi:hypothetical protein
MLLILELVVGVAAGVVLGFFIIANWSVIAETVQKLITLAVSIALLCGVSWGIAWVIEAASSNGQSIAHDVNILAGSVMAWLLIIGLVGWVALRRIEISREKRLRRGPQAGDES